MKKFLLIFLSALMLFSLASCAKNTDDIQKSPDTQGNTYTEVNKMFVYCGDNRLEVTLSDNPSARAFAEKLKENDITVTMNDYGDFEKVGNLGFSIVQSNTQISTVPGDVVLYQGNSITMYYDTNSWNFTLIGKIDGMTRETMLDFFGGKGEATVKFSLK